MLSGEELVKRGVTHFEVNLPEAGFKSVFSNGSWLEQKQVQAALETKKHLIGVERIEKSSTLSQAHWKEELNLAEVTHKVGGHWQYLGHNVGKILYIQPEEALFLMETNCLLLNYGGVKVSLQQAYSLLLKGEINLIKYKVYASLSRIGYKVFRHKSFDITPTEAISSKEIESNCTSLNFDVEIACNNTMSNEENTDKLHEIQNLNTSTEKQNQEAVNKEITENSKGTMQLHVQESITKKNEKYNNVSNSYQIKLIKLRKRKSKQNILMVNSYFDSLPNFLENDVITIKAQDSRFLPNTIQLKQTYTLNLQDIPKKSETPKSWTYSVSDEVNGSHIKRLRFNNNSQENTNQSQNNRTSFFSRPHHLNYINFNMFFKNTLHQVYFPSPFQSFGPQIYEKPFGRPNPFGISKNRFQSLSNENIHLEKIKDLALRLRTLCMKGNANTFNIQALEGLIGTYNLRYKRNIKLSPNFEILDEASIVETIELEDDEPQTKKQKLEDAFEERLNSLKQVAFELQNLEATGKASARHRRAFSKLLKTFNKCFNVDYNLNTKYEILDRRQITLDSSSDTECIVQKAPLTAPLKKYGKRKKLRNPFNILKRLSEKQDSTCCSYEGNSDLDDMSFNESTDTLVTGNWLPPENDFGRPVIPKKYIYDPLFDERKTNLLYDYVKYRPNLFNNWLELKIAFIENLQETITEFSHEMTYFRNNFDKDCLIIPDDCGNTEKLLQKLKIINTTSDIDAKHTLQIDFDVYNRDVEKFSKRQPPKPHFRVICLDESLKLPSALEVAAINSQYRDDVQIVFALVSVSSVSYLQVKPIETPLIFGPSC
ncbi:unnamed protein product [Leptosia nina]|uniref:tRNA-splicing endonuclease subunit Sen54 N-terminal domain-containing protein n=1 Tax=Leptosia nina TaxID=320188 RepID=A0AAV1JFT2_9NEOP